MTPRRLVKRQKQRPLEDLATDPRAWVCLSVAAHYLKIDARTLRSRIDEGLIEATEDRRTVKITLAAIRVYERHRPVLARSARKMFHVETNKNSN